VTSVWLTGKEHLLEHDFKVGADLWKLQGHTLLVICDYYRNPIEVKSICHHPWHQIGTEGHVLQIWHTRHAGTKESTTLCLNNLIFGTLSRKWEFKHVTSSPCYLQSNCKVENTVKMVKQLFTKWHESQTGKSECFTLLEPVQHHSFDTAAHVRITCYSTKGYSNTLLPATLLQAASQAP